MTCIFSHVAHLSVVGKAANARSGQGGQPDFLEHVSTEKRSTREMDARKRPSGSEPPPAGSAVTASQQSPSIHPDAGRPIDGVINDTRDATWLGNMPPRVPVSLAGATLPTRVFEQHWFANGYLSFIDADGASVAKTPGTGTRDRSFGPWLIAQACASTAPLIAASTDVADSRKVISWPVVLEREGGMDVALPHSLERMVRTLGLLVPADRPWPERLLRLSQKLGGGAALWVRDYALAPQAIEPLVMHLRQLAQKAGVALESVVVNGITVWQAETLKGDA